MMILAKYCILEMANVNGVLHLNQPSVNGLLMFG